MSEINEQEIIINITENLEFNIDIDQIGKQINLERFQGSTLGYKLIFKEDGIGINITNYKIYFTLKEKNEDADSAAKINKIITTHTDAVNGKMLIPFLVVDTKNLLGNYYYSIDYKDTENNIEAVLLSGRMKIEKTIRKTRD